MAIQAALTGHLVLSTLHTNDAPSAITRLMELGVPAYLINATLLGVMAQRLVRTLCPKCKQDHAIDEIAWTEFINGIEIDQNQAAKPVGCIKCRQTGFYGRIGLYEMLEMTSNMKDLVSEGGDLQSLRTQAIDDGLQMLRVSGAKKVASGLTTIDEVLRVTPKCRVSTIKHARFDATKAKTRSPVRTNPPTNQNAVAEAEVITGRGERASLIGFFGFRF